VVTQELSDKGIIDGKTVPRYDYHPISAHKTGSRSLSSSSSKCRPEASHSQVASVSGSTSMGRPNSGTVYC